MIELRNICCLLGLFCCFGLYGQSVSGTWKTIDDQSGKPKALVEIFTQGGKLYGKIREVLVKEVENPLCVKCEGALKDQPIEGMTIIDGLESSGPNQWRGDELLNPEEGKWYRCRIWLDPENPDVLKVRGYLAFFYRTQTWYRNTQ
jgi:uncharacterized protein (DUF2147 family)